MNESRLQFSSGKNNPLHFIFDKKVMAFFYGIYLALFELQNTAGLTKWMHPVLIAWSSIILINDYCNNRLFKNMRYIVFLVLYSLAIVFALCFRVTDSGIVAIAKILILTIYPLFNFFSLFDRNESENDLKKSFIAIILGVLFVLFIGSFESVLMYLQRKGIFEYGEDTIVLFGMYRDSNHAAIYALVAIGLCLYIIYECKKRLFSYKATNKLLVNLSFINMFFQICFFPLANSRGGWLSLFVSLFIALFVYFFFISHVKKKFIISLVLTIGLIFTSYSALIEVRDALSYISTHFNISINLLAKKNKKNSDEVISISSNNNGGSVSFKKENEKIGAGRLEYWTDTLRLMKQNPSFVLFGMSNQRTQLAQQYLPDSMLAYGVELHNSYLDVVASFGVFALIPLLFIFFDFAKNVFTKVTLVRKNDISFIIVAFVFAIITIGIFFLSCAFITTTLMYFIMLIVISYLLNYCKYINKKVMRND